MKYIILWVCGCFFVKSLFSQNFACKEIDTSGIYKFAKADPLVYFKYSNIDNNQDFLSLYLRRLLPRQPSFGLIKIDRNAQIKFNKFFPPILSFPNIIFPLFYIDGNNSILMYGGDDSYKNIGALAKLNQEGEMKWLHLYKNPLRNGDIFYFQKVIEGRNSEIITLTQSGFPGEQYKLCSLDSNGIIRWSRTYGSTAPILGTSFLVFNGIDIVVFGQYSLASDLGRKSGMFLTRINYETGEIVATKSFWLQTPFNPSGFSLEIQHLNYDSVSKRYMLDFYPYGGSNNSLAAFLFDSTLNFIKGKQFFLDVSHTYGHHTSISPENNLAYIYPLGNNKGILSTVINGNLDNISQKKITLENYFDNSYNSYNWDGTFSFKNNGYYDLLLTKYNQNDFFLLKSVSFHNSFTNCPIIDTTYLTAKELYVDTLDFQLTSKINVDIEVINLPVIPGENKQITKQDICQQVSICDSISIRPVSQYCFSDSQATISLFKNSSCLRNIQWQYDTTAFQKMNGSSDTTLTLKFLKPFNGYIYAGFMGCDISDSISINVISPKKTFEINKDSVLCPGTKITLQASPDFLSYRWQDGIIQRTRNASVPGLYKVVAVDSCGNIFSDSVLIKKEDTSFVVSQTASICPDDTLSIDIPATIKNLKWLPLESALYKNNLLQFFPKKTTSYFLKAQTTNGCEVEAALNIILKNCPEYIYFPNSFTPNNDGLNDEYRAVAEGKLIHFDLKIFNRWGQLIFKNQNIAIGWDGTFNGSKAETGSYVYWCNYQFKNGAMKNSKGHIMLIK